MPVQFLTALIALSIASVTDMQTREVPDWISYTLLAMGIMYHVAMSIAFADIMLLVPGIIGFGLFYGLAYIMYYTGQWGGGDSKLLMGLGALFGIPYSTSAPFIQFSSFLVSFFLNLLLVGVVYAMGWAVYLAIRHFKQFKVDVRKEFDNKKGWRRIFLIGTGLLLILIFILSDPFSRVALALIVLLAPLLLYLSIFTKAVEKSAMLKRVDPKVLTEGDWVAEDVVVNGKRIAGPKDLGVTKKQIAHLVELHQKKKIKHVLLKVGMPFVPTFLISLIVTQLYGNLYSLLIPF